MAYWNFPAVAGGNINSINNAGLETFRENPIDALTREICQNSLDAVKDPEEPVIVSFNKFTTNELPGKEELMDAFQKAKGTWEGRNAKSESFIEQALHILEKDNIDFLRISDFNTVGLKGARDAELGSPWSSLIREAGSSNKKDDSGGSFGIGKAAPFLNSNLRTLFYSSYDDEGYQSHVGVANIMSFHKVDNRITLGNGYYTNSDESKAIEGLLHLDPQFKRDETGTDIFLTSFRELEDWKEEMIYSVLKNFFLTVYQNQLVVRVDDIELNQENIGEFMANLEDTKDNQILKQYFELLSSEKTVRIPYPAKSYKKGISFEEGEAELLLMGGEDLNRRVLMTRKTGMRIFEQKNISGSISFTGLLMMKGKNMNKIFKEMENPAHDDWHSNRYEEDPKLANKIYADLRRFIRDQVKEIFQQNKTDKMDAVGLSDFLPNKNLVTEDEKEEKESIQSRMKSMVSKEKKQPASRPYEFSGDDSTKTEEQILGESGLSTGNQPGGTEGDEGSGDSSGGDTSEPGGPSGVNPDDEGAHDSKAKEKNTSVPIKNQQKYICANKQDGQYRFAITPEKEVQEGYLKFKVMGEQTDNKLPIKQAAFNDSNITIEKVKEDTIYFKTSQKTTNLNVDVQVEYSEYCVMEVGVYENQ